jgi:hypothetical protein
VQPSVNVAAPASADASHAHHQHHAGAHASAGAPADAVSTADGVAQEASTAKPHANCCSAVSALTLPMLLAVIITVAPLGRLDPSAAVAGTGLDPTAPAKPPRPAYQC